MGKLKISLKDLFNIPSAVIYNPDSCKSLSNVEIDSRKVVKGSIFLAIKGEKFDGHNFVFDAVKNGASVIAVNKKKIKKFIPLKVTIVAVDDTLIAYGDLANIWRHKLNAKVISVSGSNGKTTTKEILSVILGEKFKVVKTEANNNNHIGVPLTIFSADEKCEVLVLEQGTNHFGEIAYSAKISEPDYSLLTNIGDSHLEFLKNREGVYREKSALLSVTDNRGGKVFVNMDDPIIKKYAAGYKNKITYGFNGKVDVKGRILGFTENGKTKIQIQIEKEKLQTVLPLYGEANAKNFLAAAAVAYNLGITAQEIITASQKLQPVHGRLELRKYSKAIIIDDTYNASPASVINAYELVKKIKVFKNKIVILGDMFELGNKSAQLHKELARLFEPEENLVVLTIGKYMKHFFRTIKTKKVKSIHFDAREELSLYLQYVELENSVILVKGSRGMRMEEFVNILDKRFE